MVNASLNWASIVGIVLAVCGAGLYFMRTFKPALARDYDVFFAAIGLLCGGILFFQGWRLDPILQFGQFLLAGTTVFFAYESVRLRGVATDQARRSSYFDDEPSTPPRVPRSDWDDSSESFGEQQPLRRRFTSRENYEPERSEEDFYRPRRPSSRAAIPEEAVSRRRRTRDEDRPSNRQNSERVRRMSRFNQEENEPDRSQSFGDRRNSRQEQRRGSRPSLNQQAANNRNSATVRNQAGNGTYSTVSNPGIPKGSPIRQGAEDAAFSPTNSRNRSSSRRPIQNNPSTRTTAKNYPDEPIRDQRTKSPKPRDNNSRFDD